MKNDIKKDLKESFEIAVISVLCILFVLSMNSKCSNPMNKKHAKAKSEIQKVRNLQAAAVLPHQKTR